MLCSQAPRALCVRTLFYLGLLILSKRNSFKINLEGRWEGGGGCNTRTLYFAQEDLFYPKGGMHSGFISGDTPKGIISVSLFHLLFHLFFLWHICSCLFSLQTNSLLALQHIKHPNMQPPSKCKPWFPRLEITSVQLLQPSNSVCAQFQNFGAEIWLAQLWSHILLGLTSCK